MKKSIKVVVSLILCLTMLFAFTSCNFAIRADVLFSGSFGNNYIGSAFWNELFNTAGDPQYVWVETYDDLAEVVEKMKEQGTMIPRTPVFDCEDDGFDVKFRISYRESTVFGKNKSYCEKYLYDVSITCYVFFEEVSVENYESDPEGYDYFEVVKFNDGSVIDDPTAYDDIEFVVRTDNASVFDVIYNGRYQFECMKGVKSFEITNEQLEIFKSTLKVIE